MLLPIIGGWEMVLHLERRTPDGTIARYYCISVRPTLFGSWAVVREWGRIGFAGGAHRETWFETETEARQYGERLALMKQRRGYVVVP